MTVPYDLVLVGGGLAACVALMEIARKAPPSCRLAIINKTPVFGAGLAYATQEPQHLLNVRACRMSLVEDEALDFVLWASVVSPEAFVPRGVYGAYIVSHFWQAQAAAIQRGITVDLIEGTASGFSFAAPLYKLEIANGNGPFEINTRALLLCEGPPPLEPLCKPHARWLDRVWPTGLETIDPDCQTAIILGSGLTALDVALSLLKQPTITHIEMVSLDGQLPEPHADTMPDLEELSRLHFGGLSPANLLLALKRARRDLDWRLGIDALRPQLNEIWRGWTDTQRQACARRLATIWTRHRHRAPRSTLDALSAAMDQGRLSLRRGRVSGASCTDLSVLVELEGQTVTADIGIDARGFGRITAKAPTLCGLAIGQGLVDACPVCGGAVADEMGLATDADMPPIYVVGAARFGHLLETTGAPEIIVQTRLSVHDWLSKLGHNRA